MTDTKEQGMKTINLINKLPVVNSAYSNATYYYNTLKNSHNLIRMGCSLAEYSCQVTAAIASPPFFYFCETPSK